MVCVLQYSYFFLSFLFFLLFLLVFSLTDTNESKDRTGEGIIFLVFHFHPLTNIYLIHRDFYHLFLLDLFVITMVGLVNLRYLHFICIFMNAIKSELLTLTFQLDTVRMWAHIKLSSPFYYKANTLKNWDLHLSYQPPLNLTTTPSHNLSPNLFPKCIRNKRCFIFFTRDWKKNNKKQSSSFKIGNYILIYINVKHVFQIDIDCTRC